MAAIWVPGLRRRRLAPPGRERETDLDVVRGVAILLAVGWHLAGPTRGIPVLDTLFWPARQFGWAGVDLFFVLSGFLVGRIIFREHVRTGTFDARRFFLRRIFKLWPMFYLFLVAEAVLGNDPWQRFLLQNLTHLQNYLSEAHPHLWSLAVEEHFYLLAVIVLPLLMRRHWTPKKFRWLFVAVVAAVGVLRTLAYLGGVDFIALWWQTQYRIDALAFGVLLAVIAVYTPDVWTRLVSKKAVWLTLSLFGLVWLALIPVQSPLGVTAGFTVSFLTAASFLLLLHRASWITRFARPLRPVALLGVFSYAIYLWHIAIAGVIWSLVSIRLHWNPVVGMLLQYLGVVVFAVVLTRLVEWPVLRLRDRFVPGRRASDPLRPDPPPSPS